MDMQRKSLFMFLLEEDKYEKKIPIIKKLEKTYGKICYVCLSDTIPSVLEELGKRGIDTLRFLFIDTLSSYYGKQESTDQVIYLSSPSATQEIFNAIQSMKNRCEVFVFDNISELLAYQEASSILKFTNDVKIGSHGEIVYIVPKGNAVPQEDIGRLITDLTMFADETIDLNK